MCCSYCGILEVIFVFAQNLAPHLSERKCLTDTLASGALNISKYLCTIAPEEFKPIEHCHEVQYYTLIPIHMTTIVLRVKQESRFLAQNRQQP
jgi:hypothetical protein